MMILIWISAAFLFVAFGLVLYRIERGPSMLDRMVGVDVVTSILIGAIILIIAGTYRTDLVPVLIVVSLVGFIGSTTVARFAAKESTVDKKVLSKDEVAKLLATRSTQEETERGDGV